MQQNADSLKCFLKELTDNPSFIETYDSILWNSMLDEAIVNEDGTIQVQRWKRNNIIIFSPLVNADGLFLSSLTITPF